MKFIFKVFCVHESGNVETKKIVTFGENIKVSFVCPQCQREIVVSLEGEK